MYHSIEGNHGFLELDIAVLSLLSIHIKRKITEAFLIQKLIILLKTSLRVY